MGFLPIKVLTLEHYLVSCHESSTCRSQGALYACPIEAGVAFHNIGFLVVAAARNPGISVISFPDVLEQVAKAVDSIQRASPLCDRAYETKSGESPYDTKEWSKLSVFHFFSILRLSGFADNHLPIVKKHNELILTGPS